MAAGDRRLIHAPQGITVHRIAPPFLLVAQYPQQLPNELGNQRISMHARRLRHLPTRFRVPAAHIPVHKTGPAGPRYAHILLAHKERDPPDTAFGSGTPLAYLS